MANFSTLVAIIAALQSEWVTKAMRKSAWSRVGLWENRMFKDLKIFTTNSEDFKYIRQVVESIVDAKPLDANTHAASVVSGGGADTQPGKSKTDRPAISSVCIPFIGSYFLHVSSVKLIWVWQVYICLSFSGIASFLI